MSSIPQSPAVADLPRIFGQQDARAGATCVPEMYFVRHADKVAYCHGYESVSGPTLTTAQFTGSEMPQPAPVAKAHNWHAHNLDRGSRHLRRIDAIFERTLRESGVADLLWLPESA